MTRELIAQAWHKARNAWMTQTRHGTQEQADAAAIEALTAAFRAQAEQPAEPIPVVDGSKPYYVEMPDGVRRKYLPGAVEQPAKPQGEPVAVVPIHPKHGPLWANTTSNPSPERLPSYPLMSLYARPDPRVAEYRALLREAMERMTRARSILTDDHPRPGCNWGMLDVSDIEAALGEG